MAEGLCHQAAVLLVQSTCTGLIIKFVMVFAGFSLTKAEVIAVVHVGETTLSKRVSEFAATNEASLTAQKFKQYVIKDEEAEEERLQALRDPLRKPALEGPDEENLCPHASKPLQSFAYDKPFNV